MLFDPEVNTQEGCSLGNHTSVEPSGVQALKNPNPLKDVEVLAMLAIAVLF